MHFLMSSRQTIFYCFIVAMRTTYNFLSRNIFHTVSDRTNIYKNPYTKVNNKFFHTVILAYCTKKRKPNFKWKACVSYNFKKSIYTAEPILLTVAESHLLQLTDKLCNQLLGSSCQYLRFLSI